MHLCQAEEIRETPREQYQQDIRMKDMVTKSNDIHSDQINMHTQNGRKQKMQNPKKQHNKLVPRQ